MKKYRWSLGKLKFKKFLARIYNYPEAYQQYEDIIRQYSINPKLNKEDFLIMDTPTNVDFGELQRFYTSLLGEVDDDLYDAATDMFSWFQDLSVFNDTKYEDLNMNDKELVLYARDVIKSMDDKKLLLLYDKLTNKHYVNILNHDQNYLTGASESMMGITMVDYMFNTSYINIFRKHTVEDIDALVHETMHAYYNYLLCNTNSSSIKYFLELEGEFGSLYTTKYLESVGISDGTKLRTEQLNFHLCNSYLLMANHILFSNPNNMFDVSRLNQKLKELLPDLNIIVEENDINNYLTVQGFLKVINIVSYLTVLDLMEKHDTLEVLDLIYNLKINDNEEVINNLKSNGITFFENGYKPLFTEYNYTRKKTLHR